jgi:L-amino acid N-acyltransferase YncA
VSDPTFREADSSDWAAIWPIVSEVVRASDTYAFPVDMGEEAARTAWMPDPGIGRRTFVAEVDGTVVGTAYLKPNLQGPGDHVGNAGWMIAPAHEGRGIGRAFAEHIVDEARRSGFTAMQFNEVVATNRRAIALWKSLGFQVVGTIPAAFRHPVGGLTSIHVMHREL